MGTFTADGSAKIIGGTDYGFDGSLNDAQYDSAASVKVNPGDSKSYEVTGKVLLPVVTGKENLLAFQKKAQGIEYENSFVYFKLR